MPYIPNVNDWGLVSIEKSSRCGAVLSSVSVAVGQHDTNSIPACHGRTMPCRAPCSRGTPMPGMGNLAPEIPGVLNIKTRLARYQLCGPGMALLMQGRMLKVAGARAAPLVGRNHAAMATRSHRMVSVRCVVITWHGRVRGLTTRHVHRWARGAQIFVWHRTPCAKAQSLSGSSVSTQRQLFRIRGNVTNPSSVDHLLRTHTSCYTAMSATHG